MSKQEHPKWNYDEFLGFLLIYASSADLEFSDAEREAIKLHLDSERINEILAEHNAASDYEKLEIINTYRGLYFPTEARKKELIDRVEDHFHVDGDFSLLEENLLRMLKKIL